MSQCRAMQLALVTIRLELSWCRFPQFWDKMQGAVPMCFSQPWLGAPQQPLASLGPVLVWPCWLAGSSAGTQTGWCRFFSCGRRVRDLR